MYPTSTEHATLASSRQNFTHKASADPGAGLGWEAGAMGGIRRQRAAAIVWQGVASRKAAPPQAPRKEGLQGGRPHLLRPQGDHARPQGRKAPPPRASDAFASLHGDGVRDVPVIADLEAQHDEPRQDGQVGHPLGGAQQAVGAVGQALDMS